MEIMNSKSALVVSQNAPNPLQIFELATGFMRAKHLFVAGELGIFEKLAEGPATFDELAAKLGTPRRTTRIVADAVTALGLLERQGDKYRNSALAQAHLSGSGGAVDMRPFLRFWNRLSYKRWLGLEDSVRQEKGWQANSTLRQKNRRFFLKAWRPSRQVTRSRWRRDMTSAGTCVFWIWAAGRVRS